MLVKKIRTGAEDQNVTDEEIAAIVQEAVALETKFLTEALPVGDLGMNAGLMSQYIASWLIGSYRSWGCRRPGTWTILFHSWNRYRHGG